MGSDYRKRLYDSYVQSHLSGVDLGNRLRIRAPFLRALVNNHFPADRYARILELGCGYGALVYYAREAGYVNMRGVDISPEQVSGAWQLGIQDVAQSDLFGALRSEPDGNLDAIITVDVIEHLTMDELLAFADEVCRALSAGGRWISHQPNASSPLFGRVRYGDLTHQSAFTQDSIRQLSLAVGFSEVECYEDVPVTHGLKGFLRGVLWRLLRNGLRTYMMVESGVTNEIFSQNFISVAIKN